MWIIRFSVGKSVDIQKMEHRQNQREEFGSAILIETQILILISMLFAGFFFSFYSANFDLSWLCSLCTNNTNLQDILHLPRYKLFQFNADMPLCLTCLYDITDYPL